MMKVSPLLISLLLTLPLLSQNVQIDGRLQPLLNDFFTQCNQYQIEYHDKLFQLESIDVVNTLTVSEDGSTLGMLRRDENGKVVAIDISWMAQLDPEILKIVAFHEFAHYFLEYSEHVCDDCGHIMSKVNSSYFDIAREWEQHLKVLFEGSPAYARRFGKAFSFDGTHQP
ncbi:hypothetical protein POV27_11410 [Aureisphaera galaxeae]|uniref:hypothetical protein n=1 Tax=Aureisphaera galaxeae TaxID=1538023 RepID=UPI002350445A|nr:hypothetical protein [Aureisphaera galaxeae]MDC8004659.1 hypothetical protein [Aureisphaera galaxeae]